MGIEVNIPFLPEFEEVMDSGQKTMTSRTKWYGSEGDYFKAFGHIFIITRHSIKPLHGIIYGKCHICGYVPERYLSYASTTT